MFGLVFDSDGNNEGLIIMALILVVLVLCGIVLVCYTCTCMCIFQDCGYLQPCAVAKGQFAFKWQG